MQLKKLIVSNKTPPQFQHNCYNNRGDTMSQNSDGSVVIEFEADVSDVEKKIGRLKTEITNYFTGIFSTLLW